MVEVLGGIVILLAVLALVGAAMNYLAPLPTARLLLKMARRRAGLTEESVQIEGLKLPYLTGGHGAPLVLLHGFTANKDVFAAVAQHLTPHFTVYIPDIPGFGEATRDTNLDYGIEAQARRLWDFTQALGLKKFHLGGNSLGCWFASVLSRDHPDAVQSLWMIDAFGTTEALDSARRAREIGVTGLLVRSPKDNARKWGVITAGKTKLPYCLNYAMGIVGARDFEFHKKMWESISRERPIEASCGQLNIPTFIVYGAQDRVSPSASAKTLSLVFPRNKVDVMEGVGHIPMVEEPLRTATNYLAFRTALS